MDKWYKKDYVCSICDALIEMTTKSDELKDKNCLECRGDLTLLSVLDATIDPIKQKEEQTMDTPTISPAVEYNSDLLVTYKKINGYSDAEYVTDKVRNIEWELSNARTNSKAISALNNKIDSVRSIIQENFADSLDQDTLTSIAEALDIELTKEVSWEATIHVSGIVQVSLTEDFDLESMLMDELSVDARNGDIEVHDFEVANCQESSWQ
jgi:hypothetical protein